MLSHKEILELNKNALTANDCHILHEKYGCRFLFNDGKISQILLPYGATEAERKFMDSVRENNKELDNLCMQS